MHGIMLEPPEYLVDLNEPADERWEEVIENHEEDARELLENALDQVHSYTGKFTPLVKRVLSAGYKLSGGQFTDDIAAWAEALDVSEADVITGNVTYELAQAGHFLGSLGCTAVVLEVPKQGLVCARNMDWELEGMGRTTIALRLDHEDREIVAVTNPGLVGVLSGMVPGEFSITLNWAPPSGRPRFDFGPVFLLRYVLQNAADFDEAVEYLSDTPLSTPALFMVCGTDNACVIERTNKESAVRWFDGSPLVMTNHYLSEELEDLNGSDFIGDSDGRYASALRAAKRFKGKTVEAAMGILSGRTCLHEGTVQQIVFAPEKAEYCVRAFDNE
jgi:predicted choloylglycine hydrolase